MDKTTVDTVFALASESTTWGGYGTRTTTVEHDGHTYTVLALRNGDAVIESRARGGGVMTMHARATRQQSAAITDVAMNATRAR